MSVDSSGVSRVSGRLCGTGEAVTVTVRGGRIETVAPGTEGADLGGPDLWLAPGFLDLQLNGYRGHDFNVGTWAGEAEASTELAPIFASAAKAGTPLACPTVTTNSPERMLGALRRLSAALDAEPDLAAAVPAVHVEGPFLSPEDGPRGAHPAEHLALPDWDFFQRLQEAAGGRIRLFTLAPELPGALPLVERLAESGVTVALGHTAADPGTVHDAVSAGARMSTHLGNGAHAMLRRHPNYIWEQAACDALCASLILDGHHLPPSVARVLVRAKRPERVAIVSDAVSLGGMPPGVYAEGRHEVLPDGKIVLAGTPYLAGAGHLLDTGVANAVRFTDLSLAEAVDAVTAVPARLLSLEGRKGRIAPGYDADLVLFRLPDDGPLEIAATLRAGQVVYRSEAGSPRGGAPSRAGGAAPDASGVSGRGVQHRTAVECWSDGALE